MTIIAYRNGVMAADTGSWASGAMHGFADKLARGPDGTLYGVSGHAAPCEQYLKWVRGGCIGTSRWTPEPTPDRESSFVVLIAPIEGPVRLLTAYGEEEYSAPYYAIGASAPVAWGALYAGASAIKAILACLEHSDCAHGKVNHIAHPR